MRRGFRLLDHTADFGIEVYGEDPAELFTQAAHALFELISGPMTGDDPHRHRLVGHGADWPDLLVNWLRELLFLWSGEEQLLCNLTIEAIGETRVQAIVTTVDHSPQHHEIRNEIKAVTYHQVDVAPQAAGWVARVYLDV